jgi:hypothetical protein
MMAALGCPGEDTIVAFAEGRLAPEAFARVESHADTCAHCQDLLAAAMGTGVLQRAIGETLRWGAARAGDGGGALARGEQIGRYTVLARIGRGGMGEVYAAYDPDLDRKVALKLLHAGATHDRRRAQDRLLREAKAMAKLSHPNVVAVHDTGTFEGRVYLAMEYVDGLTLTEWLAACPRRRDEVLPVFIAAARGLVAAHEAGLVHRDFKPGNVMIARDGSPRVADFGLARSFIESADEERPSAPAEEHRDPHLTRTGELLGTPLFMAPEQFTGRAADARTDQFSFCVALYRALYGVAPFHGDTLEALTASVLAGRVEPPPNKTTVPARLRRILVRGLARDPAERWPTMKELVGALERDPARVRRRASLAAGAFALVGLSLFALARGAGSSAPLCTAGPGRLDGVWEGAGAEPHPRRDAVERAFVASGAPGAREIWDRVAARLDRYRTDWLSMYRDACEAANVRREQTPAALDLRMTCLEERRLALAALTNVLAVADRDTVGRAVDGANGLPGVDRCADLAQLELRVEPPRDEATRRRVEDLRRRAATAKALRDTGKDEEALALNRTELAEARAVGYRPLVAEMLVAFSQNFQTGAPATQLAAIEEEAIWTSLAVGRDDLAAEASIQLTGQLGNFMRRYQDGLEWARISEVLLDRAGAGQEILRSWLLHNEATTEHIQHHGQRALELIRQAVALKEKALPADSPDLATSLNTEANELALVDRNAEALRLNERAYDIFVRAYGPASLAAAFTLSNRGEYLIALGRPEEALAPLRRALVGWEAHVGSNHAYLGYPLTALGRALIALGRAREALPPLERALPLREAGEPDAPLVAETRFALARALSDADADRRRARALAEKARATYATAKDDKHTAEIDAWLAARAR